VPNASKPITALMWRHPSVEIAMPRTIRNEFSVGTEPRLRVDGVVSRRGIGVAA
jgi:hypothetical protein